MPSHLESCCTTVPTSREQSPRVASVSLRCHVAVSSQRACECHITLCTVLNTTEARRVLSPFVLVSVEVCVGMSAWGLPCTGVKGLQEQVPDFGVVNV